MADELADFVIIAMENELDVEASGRRYLRERLLLADLYASFDCREAAGKHGPPGLYLLPRADTEDWHGVIFLRQGFYRHGIFRFLISFPDEYREVSLAVIP